MKIKFKNGSYIECIDDISDAKRSQRGEEQIQYWQRNPDKYIEFVTGAKLLWYQKMWLRLELMRRRIL